MVQLLKDPRWPGYRPAWGELVEQAQRGGDPRQVTLTLSQGYLDPLTLMDFKILPAWVLRDSSKDFAEHPIGSGPYQYMGRKKTRDGREYAQFLANPNYGSRADRLGLPFIREIQFFVTTNPAEDLQRGRVDLCPDVPTDQLAVVEKLPGVQVLKRAPNRRVYFLAINHRNTQLRDSANLRRALALAINREELLDKYFRNGRKEFHRSLRGPYPADSWAYDPRTLEAGTDPLFNKFEAGKLLEAAKKEGWMGGELRLLYPDDDPRVGEAMKALQAQVQEAIGVKLNLTALDPHKLSDAVEGTHSYDLAYYSHDYESEAYWLWPQFDPNTAARAPGGSNFLGYVNDSELQSLFQAAMSHRNFHEVQNATRAINAMMEKSKMPLIPLWQLDKHLACRAAVKPAKNVDPLLVFTQIDQWQKAAGR
jgi:ABC-type transport system substrate-binding protein